MTDPRQKYRESIQSLRNSDKVTKTEQNLIEDLCRAYDKKDMTTSPPNDGEWREDTTTKEANTILYWCVNLKRVAERLKEYDVTLDTAEVEDINRLMSDMSSGLHPAVKDDGLKSNAIRNYQGCIRRFYFFHDDLGVDRNDITLIKGDNTHVNEQDMLTPDEITQLREAADHPRDLAIFDLLLYTGQRNTAIRSLRIKDIDLSEQVYYLNNGSDGLKGADSVGSKRPLLGATGSVREWLRYHPFPDNPEAYLITPKPRYSNPSPDKMVSRNTLGYAMKKLKEKTDITKPVNPHNIRHNFVTIAKREYDMDNDTIKHLIGHKPDSSVMESTYAHLSDDDHIKAAEVAMGVREDTEEKSLTPQICHCGEPLPKNAKACPRCGTIYAPDAVSAKEKIDDQIFESMAEADNEGDKKDIKILRKIIRENPEAMAELLKEED